MTTQVSPAAVQLKPVRLDVDAPWELKANQRDVIARAIAGEAWLERMGLVGLVTGVSNSHMPTFVGSVERLVGQLRYARQYGRDEARAEVVRDFEECELPRWRRRVGYAALAALGVGVLFGALLF